MWRAGISVNSLLMISGNWNEKAFRYNNQGLNDGERFDIAVRRMFGKRLTWNRLTGKEADSLSTLHA